MGMVDGGLNVTPNTNYHNTLTTEHTCDENTSHHTCKTLYNYINTHRITDSIGLPHCPSHFPVAEKNAWSSPNS